jgi:hypothetical protein
LISKPTPIPGRVDVTDGVWEKFVQILFSKHSREIREHLWTLWQIAGECDSVAEFGVKRAFSTTAFLAAGVKRLVSVDLRKHDVVDELLEMSGDTEFDFRKEDCRYVDMPDCDFLFIDSTHTGQHLRVELENQAVKAKRFIGFHDTVSAGLKGFFYRNRDPKKIEAYGADVSIGDRGWKTRGEGLMPVIEEFMDVEGCWSVVVDDRRVNGLLVIERDSEL